MRTDVFGEIKAIVLWPKEVIHEAFEKAENANGSPDELEQLRSFYRTMKIFYKVASSLDIMIPPRAIDALYEYAKAGLLEVERRENNGKTKP